MQTESCGTLKKKLELGAGPAQNREISGIKSCDRKGRFVKGQWWNANEVRRFEMAANGGITSAGRRNASPSRSAWHDAFTRVRVSGRLGGPF